MPPSRIGAFQAKVEETFKNACAKGSDVLTRPQLKKLVETIGSKLQNFECVFKSSDADEIHKALDSDGDGIITSIEFVSWILRGAALSFQERKNFCEKSELHKRMCNFLEAVCVLCGGADLLHGLILAPSKLSGDSLTTEEITAGLLVLFNQFDTDKSGSIDKNELKALMIDLPLRFYVDPSKIPTSSDVDTVMNALDADESGEIDFDEWKDWILGNRNMSKKQRETFAAQSTSHNRLNGFVETLIQITADMTLPLGGEDDLREGLVTIFNESATPEGHVGANEVYKMVAKLSVQNPQIKWFDCNMEMAKTISEALDADGNGTIEAEEWVNWMIRGASRPAIDRAKFAAHSETFMILTQFLEAVANVAKKITLLKKNVKD